MRNNQNDSFRDNMLQHTTFICSVPYYPTIFINYACVLSRLLDDKSHASPSNSPIFSRQRFRSAATSPAYSLSKTSALSAIRCLSRTVSRVRSASFGSFSPRSIKCPRRRGEEHRVQNDRASVRVQPLSAHRVVLDQVRRSELFCDARHGLWHARGHRPRIRRRT